MGTAFNFSSTIYLRSEAGRLPLIMYTLLQPNVSKEENLHLCCFTRVKENVYCVTPITHQSLASEMIGKITKAPLEVFPSPVSLFPVTPNTSDQVALQLLYPHRTEIYLDREKRNFKFNIDTQSKSNIHSAIKLEQKEL